MTGTKEVRRHWKSALRRAIVLAAAVSFGLYLVFFFAQSPLIFTPNTDMAGDPSAFGWDYDSFALAVPGGTTHGWYIPLADARGTILYSHGNDSNVSHCLGIARRFREMGFSALLYDYGGYGQSTGKPSERRLYADAVAAWDYLTKERQIPAETIILWGPSFGGGPTCELATRVQPAGVVLENTFSSMADAAFKDYPWFPGSLFIRHRFNNKAKMGKIPAPVLVIHSQGDRLYPYAQGQLLFARANKPKQFLEVYGDHGEGASASPELFMTGVEGFLAKILPDKSNGPLASEPTVSAP